MSSEPIRLDPGVRTVAREFCWRLRCRDEWTRSGIATIAHLSDGRTIAWCHRRVMDPLDERADRWANAA